MIDFCQISTSRGTIRGAIHHSLDVGEYSHITLILHGYLSSNKIGPHRLYFQMARHLSTSLDSCVARFDCIGMGESDGDIENIDFDDFIFTYDCIIKYFAEIYGINSFFLIGHCVGANLALHIALRHTSKILGLILISPSLTDHNSLDRLFSHRGHLELISKGFTSRKGLFVHGSFFLDSNSRENILYALGLFPGNISVIESENDEYYLLTNKNNLLPCHRYHCVSGADHNYLEPKSRNNLFNIIVNEYKEKSKQFI